MLAKILLGATLSLCATGAHADSGCHGALMARYRQSAPIVDSMRPDKGAQMRVFASDGSVFTGGQAQWMQGQLRKFERLCARTTDADQAEAAKVLAGVEELLKSHRQSSG
jgi:type IV pilus biogenesis protein CpaD/CtpE